MFSVFSNWTEQEQRKAKYWFTGVELELGVKTTRGKLPLSKLVSTAANAVAPKIAVQSGDDIAYGIINKQAYTFVRESTGSGFELTSPKLRGKEGRLRDFHTIVCEVKKADGLTLFVGASDGIHIHVDAESLTTKEVLSVVRNFSRHQAFIYDLLAVSKERLHYCKPLPIDIVNALVERRPQTTSELLNLLSPDPGTRERYYGLNLFSLKKHGTLEFRLFNASLDPEHINFFHDLTLALVIKSVDPSTVESTLALCPNKNEFFVQKSLEQAGNELFSFLNMPPVWQKNLFFAKNASVLGKSPLTQREETVTYAQISAAMRITPEMLRPGICGAAMSGLLAESTMTTNDEKTLAAWKVDWSFSQAFANAVREQHTPKPTFLMASAEQNQNEGQHATRRVLSAR